MDDLLLITTLDSEKWQPNLFEVNWDFFAKEDGFEDVIEDPEFRERAERIAKLSAKAFWNTDVAFLCTHICIRAFLNSYAEEFRAQEKVMDTVGMMLREDIFNFGGVFAVGRTNSEFEKAVIFTLWWFEELIRRYAWNWFMGAKDKFWDFIHPFMDEDRTIHFEFPQSHFNSSGWYSAWLQIDLQNKTMNLRLKDHIAINESREQGRAVYLSEYLEANDPFLQNNLLNFLLPMWYRGFIFPLFNVNKITLVDIKGSEEKKEYAHLSSQDAIETTAETVVRTLSQ